MRIGAAQGAEIIPNKRPKRNAPNNPVCFGLKYCGTGILKWNTPSKCSPIMKQTRATTIGQNLPVIPKSVPSNAATNPIVVNIRVRPKTKISENRKARLIPLVSLNPPTNPMVNGIIASTQGFDAVIIPPTKTAMNASQGLVWIICSVFAKS